MCKKAYISAFKIMKTQNKICDKFEDVGFVFEYGQGFMGSALEDLLNQSYTIIKSVMGFNNKTHRRTININGYSQNVCFDVLYIGEYDEDWTISEDDFSDFIYQAVDNEELQELFWKSMIEKDEASKEKFNQIAKDCQIGRCWKD